MNLLVFFFSCHIQQNSIDQIVLSLSAAILNPGVYPILTFTSIKMFLAPVAQGFRLRLSAIQYDLQFVLAVTSYTAG